MDTFYITLTNNIIFTKWNNCFSPNKRIEGSGSSSRQWTMIRRPGLCSLLKSWTFSEPVCLPLKGGMIFKSFWTPLIIHLWPHHPKLAVNSFQIFLMLFYPSLVLLLAVYPHAVCKSWQDLSAHNHCLCKDLPYLLPKATSFSKSCEPHLVFIMYYYNKPLNILLWMYDWEP